MSDDMKELHDCLMTLLREDSCGTGPESLGLKLALWELEHIDEPKEKLIMKTIKLYQAKGLIYQRNIDDLFCIDRVSSGDYMEIIFKKGSNNQLYSFYYYCYSDGSNLGLATNTTKQFDVFLDDTNNRDLDVEVAPVKKASVISHKYIGDDYNE